MLAKIKVLALLCLSAVAVTGCGKSPSNIFKDAQYATYEQNGETYASVTTKIESKDIIFSNITLPIYDRKDNTKVIGEVNVSTDTGTQVSTIALALNVSQVLNLPDFTFDAALPNGVVWPITGIDASKMMAFDIGSKGSKAYLYYDTTTKQLVLGAALNVDSLSIGIPSNLFSNIDTNSLTGLVGLYFGLAPNTSGIAFLIDTGKKTNAEKVQFIPLTPNSSDMQKIDQKLYELNRDKARLIIQ